MSDARAACVQQLKCGHKARAWVSDFNDANYRAGRRAVKNVWNVEPDLTREGGSIPITLELEDATGETGVQLAGHTWRCCEEVANVRLPPLPLSYHQAHRCCCCPWAGPMMALTHRTRSSTRSTT